MFNEGNIGTFTAGEALEAHRRVKLSSGVEGQVEYADAADDFIGVTETAAALGAQVAVRFKNAPGTVEIEASVAITVNVIIYGAADGKVAISSTSTAKVGRAFEAASGNGAVIECMIDRSAA